MAINPEIVSPNVKLNVTNVKSIFNGGGKGSAIVPNKSGALVGNKGGALSGLNAEKVFQLNDYDPLEKRVAANERKITLLKRVVQSQDSFGGKEDPLRETNAILEDIGNALALDFSNRITQRQDELDSLREGVDSKRRGGAESGAEAVKKISAKVGNAFSAVTAPAKSILDKVIGFFSALAAGFIADKALKWLAKNQEAVIGFFKFLADHGAKILAALGIIIGGVIIHKIYKVIRGVVRFIKGAITLIKNAIRIARMLLKFGPKALGKLGKGAKFLKGTKPPLKKTKGIFGKIFRGKVTKEVAEAGGKKVIQGAAKKGAGKMLAKKIPIIGLGLGAIFAVERAMSGDFLGASMELASGAASTVPGWGTAASVAIDAALIGKDVSGANNEGGVEDEYKNIVNTASNMNFSKNVKSESDLKGPPKGGTTVTDVVKAREMANSQQQNGINTDQGDSLPMVGSEDASNFYLQYTKEQLGIFE